MSGYAQGLLTVLAVNVVLAYGAFLPMAAGQLNFGVAAFAAVGAYASAVMSNHGLSPIAAVPLAACVAGVVGMVVSIPILRTRGIYLALATLAFGQVVLATLLNLDFVGHNGGTHRFTQLRILVRMFGDKRLKQPENIVEDLHLPIAPRPCANADSRYL